MTTTRRPKVRRGLTVLLLGVAGVAACARQSPAPPAERKLYWFIPDGLRADPELFQMFAWAQRGELPNIQRMMHEGAFAYSRPDFPSHTPTNFASLLTGSHPLRHGIVDGPMHTEGHGLDKPAVGGFSSAAKRAPPIWKILEASGRRVALLSIPGSTPPELVRGITVRGRWGGWGADTPALIFEPRSLLPKRRDAGKALRLFFLGQPLTNFVDQRPGCASAAAGRDGSDAAIAEPSPAGTTPPGGIEATAPKSFGATLSAYGATFELCTSSSGRGTLRLPSGEIVDLREGETSLWSPVELTWQGQTFASAVRARLIKVWRDTGEFRLRLFFNNVNRLNSQPPEIAEVLTRGAGPMVDFVDNWPSQLVYEPEDEATFREEAFDSLAWHARAAEVMLSRYRPDIFLQDTYTPNQMLEARYWLPHVDRAHPAHDPAREAGAWRDLRELYRGIDRILGAALRNVDDKTIVVISSDHGIASLHKLVCLNNLFAARGWLHYRIDPESGEPQIDWARTTVVYLKMAHVYVNPAGLAGPYERAHGPAYDQLRSEVLKALAELRDGETAPLSRAAVWEDLPSAFGLPADRSGDIVLAARSGYGWFEEVSTDGALFATPRTGGYKQALESEHNSALWTPFVIMGPGVRAGVSLPEPIEHADQVATLLRLLGVQAPPSVEGRVLDELLVPAPGE